MRPAHVPRLAEPPREADVAVIGAGAAGIGAARRLLALGLTVAVVEARDRVGGRAVTVPLHGHPVDLGAHWLHAGPINPLVAARPGDGASPCAGRRRRATSSSRGRPAGRAKPRGLDGAFDLSDRAMAAAARRRAGPADGAGAAARAGAVGPPGRRRARTRLGPAPRRGEPARLSRAWNTPTTRFIAGGLGAYLSRLADGLPIRLAAPARAIDWSGPGIRVETAAGTLKARALVLAMPIAVLQAGAIRFTPALPNAVAEAMHGFTQGVYEHIVLHWPHSPFRGADRLASLSGTRRSPPGLMTCLDGTPFHLFELDRPSAAALDGRDRDAPARFARAVLAEHFGPRALAGLSVPAATAWRNDPFARASWAVVPPGKVAIRAVLKAPLADRLWFAGEALAKVQWGTAGGAFAEGERAAEEIAARLKRQGRTERG